MSINNLDLIRAAYEAYAGGNIQRMLSFVDPDLEWTYLDPSPENAGPQVCRGRRQLERALQHWAAHGLRAQLEEIAGSGEHVMVCVGAPGIDAHYGGPADDRAYSVLTVRDGRIVALRDCRDRREARSLAGLD